MKQKKDTAMAVYFRLPFAGIIRIRFLPQGKGFKLEAPLSRLKAGTPSSIFRPLL